MAYEIGKQYYFVSNGGSGPCLNVYGYDTIENNRNVCVWQKSNSKAQKWSIENRGGGKKIVSTINSRYALNIWMGANNKYNCDVYPESGNNDDSLIVMDPVDSKENIYRIKIAKHNRYLTATGVDNGDNVNWQPLNGSLNQRWKIVGVGPVDPPVTGDYQWPTISKRVTSEFRTLERPNHNGIDIGPIKPGVDGDEIFAFADGIVVKVATPSTNPSEGYTVRIAHTNPKPSIGGKYLRSDYLHLCKKSNLVQGQSIKKGDLVGFMGNTGDSKGTHLHFQLRYNSSPFTVNGDFYEGIDFTNPKNYFNW